MEVMTELQLYKFIQENEVEISWHGDEYLNLWLDRHEIKEFADLLDRCDADDGGIDCKLQNGGTIVFNLLDICDEYDINPENILAKD